MKNVCIFVVLMVVLALTLSAAPLDKKQADILPAEVRQAFKAAYPNAVIKRASKEVAKGVTLFEVESLDGTQPRDLLYAADGKVIEMEEAMAAAALPNAVSVSLAYEFPGYQFLRGELLTKGTQLQYEVLLQVKAQKMEVVLDPAGKIVQKTEIK